MLSKFNSYIEQGLIKKQVSPCGRLVLFDYTEKCQFEKAWDEVTLNARGTVYELETGKVVARAFPKFFNWSELQPAEQNRLLGQTFNVAEKMDGSLGIVYYYDGEWRVNTRGSFTSDQAIKGKQLLESYNTYNLHTNKTYLVEIIYPENRIVVNYEGHEALILLGIYDNKTGEESPVGARHAFIETANTAYFSNIEELQAHLKTLTYNEEGYVVRFSDGTRAKFKGDEYIKMHRIVTGISPLVLWENMKGGRVSEELLASIPEEFRTIYEDMAYKLEMNFLSNRKKILYHISKVLDGAGIKVIDMDNPEQKRAIGIFTKTNGHEYNQFVFPYLLDKGFDDMVQKTIRPTGNKL